MDKIWQAAKLRAALLTAAASVAAAGPACAQEQAETLVTFSIPSQNTASALIEFARQADAQILFSHEAASRTTAPAVVGEFTKDQGLQRLLLGSSLSVASNDGRTITLRAQEEAQAEPTPVPDEPERVENAADHVAQGEIVIVGTNIRGLYPEMSPFQIYDLEDIARTGAVTLEDFVEKLPQNFGTRRQYGSVTSGNREFEAVNGVDIRGIGVGTTLTLLNGRRLALASSGQVADVSLIPMNAIERVEVLTDGASAIYGADAVGGVVNFVLRDSFDGAETRASYGGVTGGNLTQGNISQMFGRSWNGGNAVASVDYYSASALETTDRSYSAPAGPGHLTPHEQRETGFVTFSQDLGDRITVNGDAIYSRRDVKSFGTLPITATTRQRFDTSNETNQYFVNLGVDLDITESLVGSILASYSDIAVDTNFATTTFTAANPAGTRSAATRDTAYSALDITAKLDGDLFQLPGGSLRFSVGGGVLNEEYIGDMPLGGTGVSLKDLGRITTYGFAEVFAPIVGAEQNIPALHRLEISVAARYTDYDDDSQPALTQDFGSDTSPKYGLLWSPVEGLNLRGTYGESFRAPTLSELDPTLIQTFLRTAPQSGVGSPAIILLGPGADLDVETSESWTAGLDYRPNGVDGPYLSVTYFNIDYKNRIATPQNAVVAANPSGFTDILFTPTSAAQIEQFLREIPVTQNTLNPSSITLPITDFQAAAQALFVIPGIKIFDTRRRNYTFSQIDGLDIALGHNFETQLGRFDLGLQATRILEFKEQASPGSAISPGTDVVMNPADFRARLFGTYSTDGFSTTVSVNYVDDYKNPITTTNVVKVDDWTTVDWVTRYEFGGDEGFLSGFGLSLSVQNALDEDPPFAAQRGNPTSPGLVNGYGFDPTNADPLGRVVLLGLTKTW